MNCTINRPIFTLLTLGATLTACGNALDSAASATSAKLQKKDSWQYQSDLPASCSKAHENFLSKDLNAFTGSLTDCMKESLNDPDMQANMLALLKQAYVLNEGSLPTDAEKPEGLEAVFVKNQIRGTTDDPAIDFNIELRFKTKPGHEVTTLELLSANQESLVNLQNSKLEVDQGSDGYLRIRKRFNEPKADGLYFLKFATNHGEMATFPLPVVDFTSNIFPKLVEPESLQRYTQATPRFSWAELPAKTPGMFRNFPYVAAYRVEAPEYEWLKVWEGKGLNWTDSSVVVGDQEQGRGVKILSPGSYVAWLSLQEIRKFGFINVTRSSADKKDFMVNSR